MRPRKVVLLFDEDAKELSVRSFLLDVNQYRVLQANTADEAWLHLNRAPYLDLAIFTAPAADSIGHQITRTLREERPEQKTLVVSSRTSWWDLNAMWATSFLPKETNTAADFLAAVHELTRRKRGPKKPVVRVAVSGAVSGSVVSGPARGEAASA